MRVDVMKCDVVWFSDAPLVSGLCEESSCRVCALSPVRFARTAAVSGLRSSSDRYASSRTVPGLRLHNRMGRDGMV